MMMNTENPSSINYKQILTDLSSIAYNHPQISSFGFGDITQCTNDVTTKQSPKYTRMYVIPGQASLNENSISYNFSIIIMDKVSTDLSNLDDVLSDTLETAKDIWTIFWQSYTAPQGDFSWTIVGDENPDIVPFTERFEDVLAGWTINLRLSHAFDYNKCVVPIEFEYGFPQDEAFTSYRKIIDDFKRFADLHYQVNSFGFGDITQLTNDILTKEEPSYIRLYVIPDLVRVHTGYVNHTWKIIVCDKLNTDLKNQADIMNDTLEVIKDLFTKMYLSEYETAWNASVEPFLEEFETTLCGWTLFVSSTQKFDYNRCVLPELPFTSYTWSELQELWKDVGIAWDKI
jgi:hypothetical protein